MSKKINTAEKWVAERVAYIKGLQKPTEHQLTLLALAEKSNHSRLEADEKKLLDAVVQVEKATEKLQAAMTHVVNVKNPQTAAQRALEARKKNIVGGYLLAHEPKIFERIVSKLTRPQDRAVFGLAPLSKTADTPAENQAPVAQPAPASTHSIPIT